MSWSCWVRIVMTTTVLAVWVGDAAGADAEPTKTPYGYTISKETTWYTGPIGADGGLDVIGAVNQWASRGVTRGNNLAIDVAEVVGPAELFDDRVVDEAVGMLKLREVPEAIRFISIEDFYERVEAGKVKDVPLPEGDFKEFRATLPETPWDASAHGFLSTWLNRNAPALNRIVGAARRKDRFYAPMLTGDEQRIAMNAMLPRMGTIRDVGRAMTLRALQRIEAGRYGRAWDDLVAAIALGRAMRGSGPLMADLAGVSVQHQPMRILQALVAEGKLDEQELVALQERFRAVRAEPPLADTLRGAERGFIVGAVVDIARLGDPSWLAQASGGAGDAMARQILPDTTRVDWDIVLRRCQNMYERVVSVVEAKTSAEAGRRDKASAGDLMATKQQAVMTVMGLGPSELETIEAKAQSDPAAAQSEMERLQAEGLRRWQELFEANDIASRTKRSEIIADLIAATLIPAVGGAGEIDRKHRASIGVTDTCIALALHRARTGAYPATLESLDGVADIGAVAADPFGDGLLVYKPGPGGRSFQLYSVGPNGRDEGGADKPADDIAAHRFGGCRGAETD